MRTTTRRTVGLVVAGALGLGGLALAAPSVAGAELLGSPAAEASAGPGWDDRDGTGMGRYGSGMNRGGNGPGIGAAMVAGARDGSCLDGANLPEKGTLTEQQRATLAAMAQEEKLAHDLYAAFAARYEAVVFDRIAASETQHLAMVRTLLDRYGLTDPTVRVPAGQFSDRAVQATYDRLLAQGSANEFAALQVGQTVEQTDIDDLRAAQDGLAAADVRQVYEHLLVASQHHLIAFRRSFTR